MKKYVYELKGLALLRAMRRRPEYTKVRNKEIHRIN